MLYPKQIAVDTHTHTVLSGHAWSTLTENAAAAAKAGLYGIAVTDHGPATPGGLQAIAVPGLKMLPEEIDGIRIFRGLEANITADSGALDVENRWLQPLDNVIASLHSLCYRGSIQENTAAYLAAVRNPFVDIIGHLHQTDVPCDMERVVKAAVGHEKVIELNASYMHVSRAACHPLVRTLAEICRAEGAQVAVSSDAHFSASVGQTADILRILSELDFPADRIVNLTAERYEAWRIGRAAEKVGQPAE